MDIPIDIFGKKLKNPLFLPSGIINDIPNHSMAVKAGVGSLVLKSITVDPREGNPIPRIAKYDSGFINSVGLRNPGLTEAKKQIKLFLEKTNTPVIISVFAVKADDFQRLVYEFSELCPLAIELNLSCPNVSDEFGEILANKADSSYKITKLAKKQAKNIPVISKLSPNTDNIGEIAKACEQAGADAVAAINTVSQGMIIDINKKRPVLGNGKGGVSGTGIKPIAVAKVYEIYEAVKIPILGIGGISTWQDAVEMIMAGASLIGIGSAVYEKGWNVYKDILFGIKTYMEKTNISQIKNLIGAAHEK
ncbi:dihydroorotate dehydrogenase [Candidatus Roizmanbacteria bacterium]|jgi:dihydroorotate dehydrogenase (NAD+) catalytic subunit|nr:dihydroorotate dehydrogenase [Candidatus Roizmanbacteria bacterium]